MKIYVAGSGKERVTVIQPILAKLREAGWKISFDWTQAAGFTAPKACDQDAGRVRDFDAEYAAAVEDYGGVVRSDVTWLVLPEEGGLGCYVEFGIALATRGHNKLPQVIVSGSRIERTIFTTLADREFATHEEALEYLKGVVKIAKGV